MFKRLNAFLEANPPGGGKNPSAGSGRRFLASENPADDPNGERSPLSTDLVARRSRAEFLKVWGRTSLPGQSIGEVCNKN